MTGHGNVSGSPIVVSLHVIGPLHVSDSEEGTAFVRGTFDKFRLLSISVDWSWLYCGFVVLVHITLTNPWSARRKSRVL